MIFRLILASALAALSSPAFAQDDLHAPWGEILDAYLSRGPDGVNRFDYAKLRETPADRQTLESYIAALEATDPDSLAPDARYAFWANLYNAATVRLIVDEAPERSIRQIRPHPFAIGPWGMELVTVDGEALSLDDIEHAILREEYEAALVHYAVNCASIGCPNLQPEPWRAETLQADLEAAAREYVNHPRGVSVTGDGLVVSRIYRWYREDFGGSEAGVIEHLLRFAEPGLNEEIRANPQITGHEYDWSLNRPVNEPE
ncbi:DUF547 domain-containing protein [Marinicauda algicola]|uniref:DUF547 domain-containing protein n=1 Tax=Marinicauda algicola TaxID=2029849 RepID=A0A4S2GXL9_9PROT|nr:DUF547 domain-containing protein [Marinicauda algicola]TGY87803.1 DUF547 domain-containing protein [Marinicauda algicola]